MYYNIWQIIRIGFLYEMYTPPIPPPLQHEGGGAETLPPPAPAGCRRFCKFCKKNPYSSTESNIFIFVKISLYNNYLLLDGFNFSRTIYMYLVGFLK